MLDKSPHIIWIRHYLLALGLIFVCFSFTAFTQTPPPVEKKSPEEVQQQFNPTNHPQDSLTTNPPLPSETDSSFNYLSSKEFIIAVLISGVSLVALLMQFFLLKKIPKLKAEDTLRNSAVVLIIMGTLFVIAAGFSSVQIAPAMGLFGTIAGYLLGKTEKRENSESDDRKNN